MGSNLNQDKLQARINLVTNRETSKNPLAFTDPTDRMAATAAKAQRIFNADWYKNLPDRWKNITKKAYYEQYVVPAYKDSKLPIPDRDTWINNIDRPRNPFTYAASDPASYYEAEGYKHYDHFAYGLLGATGKIFDGMSHAAIWSGKEQSLAALKLSNFFDIHPSYEGKEVTSDDVKKFADYTQKQVSNISHTIFGNIDFWNQTHPSQSLGEKIGSLTGEIIPQLPLYGGIEEGLAKLASETPSGVKIATGLSEGPAQQGFQNLSKVLFASKTGKFLGRRLTDAASGYLGSLLQNESPKENLNAALLFMGFGGSMEGVGKLFKVGSNALAKKFSAEILAQGGRPFQQAVTDEATHQLSPFDLENILKNSKKDTKWGSFDDPVAQDILKVGPEKIKKVQQALTDKGLKFLRPLGSGASSLVFETTDNRVVRLGLGFATKRLDIPEMLQGEYAGEIGGIRYEIAPKVDTSNITENDVKEMTKKLAAKGYVFSDAAKDNLGRTSDGRLVVIDPGAVHKDSSWRHVVIIGTDKNGNEIRIHPQTNEAGNIHIGNKQIPYSNQQELQQRITPLIQDARAADPVKFDLLTAEKGVLNSLSLTHFGKTFGKLDSAEKTVIRIARANQVNETINEFPVHAPEIAKAHIESNLAEERKENPYLDSKINYLEQKYGQKFSSEIQNAEAEKVKLETGIKSPEKSTAKVGRIQQRVEVEDARELSKAAEEEPRRYVQFKVNNLAYFRNPAPSKSKDFNYEEWLDGMSDEDFDKEVKDHIGNHWFFENPQHLMLWAYQYKNQMPKEFRERIIDRLADLDPTGNPTKWSKASKNMERHLDKLADVGKLFTEGNVFRSSNFDTWGNRTKWQKQLNNQDLEKAEKLQLAKILAPYKTNFPQDVINASNVLKNLQRLRRQAINAGEDLRTTKKIRELISSVSKGF